MVKGVTDGFTYNLKAFYSHFPMTLAVNGNTFQVNNYFGERSTTAHILTTLMKVSNKVKSPFPASTRKQLVRPRTSSAARP